MDFSLSPEHEMIRKTVREFTQKEVAPVIKEFGRKQEPIPWLLKRMGERSDKPLRCKLSAHDEAYWQS